MSDDRSFAGLVGFLASPAIGASLELLFVPQSGEETLKKIKDMSDKVADGVKENYESSAKKRKKPRNK
jgi:gas vesicle protein